MQNFNRAPNSFGHDNKDAVFAAETSFTNISGVCYKNRHNLGDDMPKAPHPESEYFGKLDVEKKHQIAEDKRSAAKKAAEKKLKDAHYGHCSYCGFEMHEIAFKGTTIFRCSNCEAASLSAESLQKLCGCGDNIIDILLETFKFKIK